MMFKKDEDKSTSKTIAVISFISILACLLFFLFKVPAYKEGIMLILSFLTSFVAGYFLKRTVEKNIELKNKSVNRNNPQNKEEEGGNDDK